MTIKSEQFGRIELSGKNAERFLRHIREDSPNQNATASYQRGKVILRHVLGEQLRLG